MSKKRQNISCTHLRWPVSDCMYVYQPDRCIWEVGVSFGDQLALALKTETFLYQNGWKEIRTQRWGWLYMLASWPGPESMSIGLNISLGVLGLAFFLSHCVMLQHSPSSLFCTSIKYIKYLWYATSTLRPQDLIKVSSSLFKWEALNWDCLCEKLMKLGLRRSVYHFKATERLVASSPTSTTECATRQFKLSFTGLIICYYMLL